ncbi:MAG TPA: CehA/McbA family metallohydrolase [Polyangiaceae bacterium]|nr:CehA/McbA family metallohydrolase [Polyangiaceae bacterium]
MKGDLHAHSMHSTDAADSPVSEVFAKAEQLGFDYFSLTDHDNHVQGKITTWGDAAYRSDTMILLYGIEWTTARGHANIFGIKPFDYAALWATHDAGDGRTAIAAAHAQSLYFFINHPTSGGPWECGFDLDFDGMEVWNALFAFAPSNGTAMQQWDSLLMSGRRMTARGGSDSHHQKDLESTFFNVGNPTTWVYAQEKTAAAVLEGLQAGHVSISYAPGAERLDFTADADLDGRFETVIGDNLRNDAKTIRFKIDILGPRAGTIYRVAVLKNGAPFSSWESGDTPLTFEDTPAAGERSYYRVELRGPTPLPEAPPVSAVAYGDFIALTNPIYIAFP